jgi:hypothetical protein
MLRIVRKDLVVYFIFLYYSRASAQTFNASISVKTIKINVIERTSRSIPASDCSDAKTGGKGQLCCLH